MQGISFKLLFIPGILLLSIFSFIFLKSCEKDKYQYPVVHTGEVTNITSEGAMFHGRITEMGSEEIVDHGFVWGTVKEPNLRNSNSIRLGKPGNEIFDANAQTGFIEGQKFYVRAFVSTPDIIIYGREIPFISKGGKSHELIDFEPKEGRWGDTITITGNYFSQITENNIVRFHTYMSRVIEASNNTLKVIVPEELDNVLSTISVSFHDHIVIHEDDFHILPPVIDSISPITGTKDTFITIYGQGFHIADNNNKVFLDTIELEILESSRNRIVTRPSLFIPHGEHKLHINTLQQKSTNYKTFFKIEPWAKLPDTEFASDGLFVNFSIGKRFYAGKTNVSRDFYEYIPAVNAWVKREKIPFSTSHPSHLIQSVSANTKGYLINLINHQSSISFLYSYSSSDNQWVNLGQLPFSQQNAQYRYSFSVIDDLYIGTQNGLLWKYSSDFNTWTQLNNNPFRPTSAQAFAFDGFGYVVGYMNSINTYGILKYDHYSDSWVMVADFSDISIDNPMFVESNCVIWSMENTVLMLHGRTNSMSELIEFLPNTNELVFQGNVPLRAISSFRFSSGNRGYFGGGRWYIGHSWSFQNDFWKFDHDLLPE
jgi:hypothetical protein